MIDDFCIGGRRYKRLDLRPELTFLYPSEIVSRLEGLCLAFGIELTEKGSPVPPDKQLSALDLILDAFLPQGGRIAVTPQNYDRLPQHIRDHLHYLIYSARQAALTLQRTQPDTPLGFLKGPRGMLSNLLMSSWIDLSQGGTVDVEFEPLD